MPEAAPIDQLKIKPVGTAQFNNRRGRKGDNYGVTPFGELIRNPADNGLDPQTLTVAEIPILQLGKYHAVVLRPAGKALTGNRHTGVHRLFFVLLKITLDIIGNRLGLLKGGTRGQNHLAHQDSLVFIREITGRHSHEN